MQTSKGDKIIAMGVYNEEPGGKMRSIDLRSSNHTFLQNCENKNTKVAKKDSDDLGIKHRGQYVSPKIWYKKELGRPSDYETNWEADVKTEITGKTTSGVIFRCHLKKYCFVCPLNGKSSPNSL